MEVPAWASILEKFDPKTHQALVAFSGDDRPLELTNLLRADGTVDWIAGVGGSRIYAISQRPSGNMVDRAAPGEEGPMLNPFFGQAVQAADIPETEMFHGDRDPLVSKFASSAAHFAGRQLVGAETGT